MPRISSALICLSLFFGLAGCAVSPQRLQSLDSASASCSGLSSTSLVHYDEMSAKFLPDETIHPKSNDYGDVVWNTRYYLESLLIAYEATGNRNYLSAFLESGKSVMSLVTKQVVANAPTPINPADVSGAPKVSVVGFTSLLSSFGYGIAIPTSGGKVAMYAQNLQTELVSSVGVTALPGGGVNIAWLDGAQQPLSPSYNVSSVSELSALAQIPLIQGTTLGRFEVTGAGLPVPGVYAADVPQPTIWVEQTAGILLPFARFLLLAKQDPTVADASTVSMWTATVEAIAANDENSIIYDGPGGAVLHNPQWLANDFAGTDTPMDYMAAEGTLRILLYELTQDSHQLDIARALMLHQERSNWGISSQGWLLLKYWPDFQPWSNRSNAPAGSIWDDFEVSNLIPAPVLDGEFNAEMFQAALQYGLNEDLGISDVLYSANRNTLLQYLFISDSPEAIIRAAYPSVVSTPKDKENPDSSDPFASAGYLSGEISNEAFITANWNWMINNGVVAPNTVPVGYFLRAWARSEAAQLKACEAR
jgi:hypothetical protein